MLVGKSTEEDLVLAYVLNLFRADMGNPTEGLVYYTAIHYTTIVVSKVV